MQILSGALSKGYRLCLYSSQFCKKLRFLLVSKSSFALLERQITITLEDLGGNARFLPLLKFPHKALSLKFLFTQKCPAQGCFQGCFQGFVILITLLFRSIAVWQFTPE